MKLSDFLIKASLLLGLEAVCIDYCLLSWGKFVINTSMVDWGMLIHSLYICTNLSVMWLSCAPTRWCDLSFHHCLTMLRLVDRLGQSRILAWRRLDQVMACFDLCFAPFLCWYTKVRLKKWMVKGRMMLFDISSHMRLSVMAVTF